MPAEALTPLKSPEHQQACIVVPELISSTLVMLTQRYNSKCTQTNDYQATSCHMTTLGLNELINLSLNSWQGLMLFLIQKGHINGLVQYCSNSRSLVGWVGLWGFLWWAPSAKRKDHDGVSSGWSSVWHRSNTGLSSSQYEQISIILGVWPFCRTLFFFRSITFWRAYG